MKWYYVENGQQRGPVSDADLEQLAIAGAVQPETLVWKEGMTDWKPHREIGAPGGAMARAATSGEAVCAECGNIFPPDEVIRYGDAAVCARCKPVFVQRLKEGAAIPAIMDYASIGSRFAALVVDSIILWIAGAAIGVVMAVIMPTGTPEGALLAEIASFGAGFAVGLSYTVYFLYKFGATPGKMLLKIRVVTGEGGRLSLGRCFGRYFAEILSGLLCGVGYLMAIFDEQKRALHDRICDTRVIKGSWRE